MDHLVHKSSMKLQYKVECLYHYRDYHNFVVETLYPDESVIVIQKLDAVPNFTHTLKLRYTPA